jgi:hypothetical protein
MGVVSDKRRSTARVEIRSLSDSGKADKWMLRTSSRSASFATRISMIFSLPTVWMSGGQGGGGCCF